MFQKKGRQSKPVIQRQSIANQMAKLSKVVNPKDCIFCKKIASDRISFGPLLLKALYTKYSSS